MTDELARYHRIEALKTAAAVMRQIADSFEDEDTRNETKSLAWAISWAVMELVKGEK